MTQKIEGTEEAQRAFEVNLSPRAAQLLALERYVDGTQYSGLKDWFSEAPIWERAPCIVYPIVKNAIDANIDLLLGDGRRPKLSTRPDEDDVELGVEGMNESDSETIDRFTRVACNEALFWIVGREAFRQAQIARSSATVWGLRAGRLYGSVLRARWCEPEFTDDGATVERIVQQYPFVSVSRLADGVLRAECKMFRRVIDAASDTTFEPIKVDPDGRAILEARWAPDPKRTVRHGLGFCPVVWYPHMRGPLAEGTFDGQALHENVTDEVRAHDYALSQRHRAALYAGDPQWTECGVEDGHNPSPDTAPKGEILKAAAFPQAPISGDNPQSHYKQPNRKPGGRRKGVSTVWSYPDPNTKVDLHVLPAGAFEAITGNANDIRVKLCESLAVVFLDAETVKFAAAMSAKAMEALRRRHLDRCDQYRDDFGEHWIKPSVAMMLRVAQVANRAAPGSVLTPGIAKAAPILDRFDAEAAPQAGAL